MTMSDPRAIAGLLVVLAACQPRGPKLLSVPDVIGCYDLHVADWNPARPGGFDSLRLVTFLPPPRVEFLSEPFDTAAPNRIRFLIRPTPGSRPSPHWLSVWSLQGDSIEAGWSTGLEGVILTLGREGHELRGHASPFTDANRRPRPVSEVAATPVACDAPPEYPSTKSQLVARRVELASGHALVLGQPLSTAIRRDEAENSTRFIVRERPVGPLSGADRVSVGLSHAGLIREIELLFPPGIDTDSLADAVEQGLIRPAARRSARGDETRRWADWTTLLSVSRWGRAPTVTLRDPRLR